jgi:hypothetical protein
MNLKSATVIIISIISIINIGYSQAAPGYLGKKTTLGIGFGIPTLQREKSVDPSSFSTDSDIEYDFGITPIFSVELTRAVNRFSSASLIYNSSSIGLDLDFIASSQVDPNVISDIEGFLNANISSISLLYNWHVKIKGHLAPLGSSYIFGIRNNSFKPTDVAFERPRATSFEELDVKGKVNINSLVVGWSHTFIIQDIIYIKPRLLFAANFKTIKTLQNDEYSFYDNIQDGYENSVYKRLIEHEAIQVELSAGILF